ncbi:MAG TPA: Crp/Fnr family transcriptional regulator [Chitinophagaceae bacterium]
MQIVNCNLEDCFLCQSCIPEWKQVIALRKRTIVVKKGKQIFKEGDPVTGIYFMYSGSAKVYKQWVNQKELIIRFVKPGDILGHRGIGDSNIYPIGATALEDSKACFIPNDFLEATLKTNPTFTYKLMHFYADELQKAEKRMRNLAHMEVKGRIAEALLEISKISGLTKDKFIALTVSRQDIASYAGTTYETVFKFLTELSKTKIISTAGKNIKINNMEKLKQYILKHS